MARQDGFSPSYWKRERLSISASGTAQTRGISSSSYKTGKYILTVYNATENKAKGLEVFATLNQGSLQDSVSGRLGGNISIAVEVKESGGNIYLEVQNNESYNLSMVVAYIVLG